MKKQKSAYKFNIFDIIIILVVLAVAAGLYYFVSAGKTSESSSEVTGVYKVEYQYLDKDLLQNIHIGDEVIENVKFGSIGTVIGYKVTPSSDITTDMMTGELKKTYYPPIDKEVEIQDNELSVSDPAEEKNSEESVPAENEPTPDEIAPEILEAESYSDANAAITAATLTNKYDYYDVTVIIKVEDMKYSDGSYHADDYEIKVGGLVHTRLPGFVGSGYCKELVIE